MQPGWLQVYGKKAVVGDEENLVAVQPNETVHTQEIAHHHLETKPPARFSEATLLSAMETAGKLVEDEELRSAMALKGLGTPATRAAIIEGLLTEKYLVREERALIPTAKAFLLLTLLRGLGVTELTMPELTGEWEHKLSQIEKGQLSSEQFMQDIQHITTTMVDRAKNYTADTIPGDYITLKTTCPKCHQTVKENYRRFTCTSCDFSISKVPGGRAFEITEIETLLSQGELPMLDGFRSKMGKPFSAALRLNNEYKLEFDFGQPSEDQLSQEHDFSDQTTLGPCPKCNSNVYETTTTYVCEHAVGAEKSCDFRSGKVILQQPIDSEQMQKLLTVGKTDLLNRFVSSRTKRAFKAYLIKKDDSTIGFEFEARAEKKPSVTKTTTKTTTKAKQQKNLIS